MAAINRKHQLLIEARVKASPFLTEFTPLPYTFYSYLPESLLAFFLLQLTSDAGWNKHVAP